MTSEQKIKQVDRLRRKYQNAFRPVVKEALKKHYSSYKEAIKRHGAQYVINNPTATLIDPGITTVIQQIYVQTGIASATFQYRQLRRLPKVERKRGTLGFNAQWTSDILAYFRLHLFNKVVLPIDNATQEVIAAILNDGITQGWTIDEMIQRIEEKLENATTLRGRTERIIRTEINRAINYGHEVAAKTYEFRTMKKWVAVHDNRTRHPHLSADGQTVDIDGSFTVGGELMDFPGDPNASAALVINCRCHTEIIAQRTSEGRLIPKDPQPVRVRGRLREQIQEIIRDLGN